MQEIGKQHIYSAISCKIIINLKLQYF